MQADYTKQLDEIVRILSKPTGPPWWVTSVSTAAFSFLLGIGGAFIGILLADSYKRRKLRRVLYANLIELFQIVTSILHVAVGDSEGERRDRQIKQIRAELKFDGRNILKQNQDLYVTLEEHRPAEVLFDRFHEIIDDDDAA